jgi:hypothetical protein
MPSSAANRPPGPKSRSHARPALATLAGAIPGLAAILVLLLAGCVAQSEVDELQQQVVALEQDLATRPPLTSLPIPPTATIPLTDDAWVTTATELSEARFDGGVATLTIEAEAPPSTRVFIEAGDAYQVGPDDPWVVQVEAPVDLGPIVGEPGMTAVAVPLSLGVNGTNSFIQWHANQGHGSYYYGDWSEIGCYQTSVPLDTAWHTFRIEYDGANRARYYLDGRLICDQWRVNETQIPTGPFAPRIHFETLRLTVAPITLEVRGYTVAFGTDAGAITGP